MWWMRRRFWPASILTANPTDDSEGMSASIASLASHPGFIYLSAQLEVHKARLEQRVPMTPPKTMDEMISKTITDARNDEAIFRIGWLRHIVLREIEAVKTRRSRKVRPDPWHDPLSTLPERPDSSAN